VVIGAVASNLGVMYHRMNVVHVIALILLGTMSSLADRYLTADRLYDDMIAV